MRILIAEDSSALRLLIGLPGADEEAAEKVAQRIRGNLGTISSVAPDSQ